MNAKSRFLVLCALLAIVTGLSVGCGGPDTPPAADETPPADQSAGAPAEAEPTLDDTPSEESPLLNATSEETLKASIEAMDARMSADEQQRLRAGMGALVQRIAQEGELQHPQELEERILEALKEYDGLTAQEFIEALPAPDPQRMAQVTPEQDHAGNVEASAQNDLKQWSLVLKMFASEERGERYPPLSTTVGVFFPRLALLYPDYITDLGLLVNPTHPEANQRNNELRALLQDGAAHAEDVAQMERIAAESYIYLGYAVTTEEGALRLLDAYEAHANDQATDDEPVLDSDIELAQALPSGMDTIFRMREGIERFLIADINNPRAAAEVQAEIPLMIERTTGTAGPINVLYLDGHVDEVTPGAFPNTPAFMQAVAAMEALRPARATDR